MSSHLLRNAVVLGLLSAVGPFAIDMYLPALPSIGADLNASTGAVQASLMAFFAAFAIFQIVYGPLSDMFGRKAPLYFGLVLFIIGGVGCALASDIETLIVFRFIQGIGGCAGMVIPRAVVRDLHTGSEATKLMSLLMLVFSVSPILAPLAGSLVIGIFDWRAVFWAVTAIGALGLLLVAFLLPETRPRSMRLESSFRSALKGYGLLLRDRHFLGLTFIGGFGISSFFAYLANSSFVLIDHYGLSPTLYSIFFSINAVSFFAMAQLTGTLVKRFGLHALVRWAVALFTLSSVALFVVMAAGFDQLAVMAAFLFVAYGFLGLVIPTTAVLAMENHGRIAGTASALMGTLQFVTGGVVIALGGVFFDGTALPMVGLIAACAVVTYVLSQVTLGRRRHAVEVPAE